MENNIILHKIIPRMKTQRGSTYIDKDNVEKQYGFIKVQDLEIPIGIDVEIEVTIRKFDKNKIQQVIT